MNIGTVNIVTAISIGAGGLTFFAIVAIAIYNRLVELKNQCENAFSQIELQLKRRHDLIPNLVECVKSYMHHEQTTLESVIAARNQAASQLGRVTQDAKNPQAVAALVEAEMALSGALGRLTAVIEAYPNLKADAQVAGLTEELTSTENRIAFARQAYNDWVTGFNNSRQAFPTCVLAGWMGFERSRRQLEFAEGAKLAEAPRVMLA
jgi:LemA protein